MGTMRVAALGAVLVAGMAAGCAAGEAPPEAAAGTGRATAKLEARAGSKLAGDAVFERQATGRILLRIVVEDVEPGLHVVHIHEHPDCSDPKAASAGGHWNPTGRKHGKWGQADGEYHLGDLGNIDVGSGRRGVLELETDLWTMGDGGPRDVVGRSIIVHAKPDDFTTQPTGDAGDRIGCGAIVGSP